MCDNCKKCKCMKNPVSVSIECKKVYYINDEELVEEIDKLIKDFKKGNGGDIQTLDDGETNPPKPPKNP